ncbi:MAG: molybdate ABC transporter substrate-binding protein [Gammaproteobacteria bacterium]|nr:molybdate ABC transporter substrate-binding protein [Gammaproteobacteria bacterium]
MKKSLFFLLLWFSLPLAAEEIRVAAASNFKHALEAITRQFETRSGHKVRLIYASTGKLYAQIVNAAPFDIFLAADSRRPQLLEQQGHIVEASRFTYAIGRLVLWTPEPGRLQQPIETLRRAEFSRLAIANPKLAPYGEAAQQLLEAEDLWQPLQRKLVRGENVGQAYQFVKTGNAQLGFVAQALLKRPGVKPEGSHWLVPQSMHSPIRQQAVLLRDSPATRAFIDFMRSQQVINILTDFGYDSAHAD